MMLNNCLHILSLYVGGGEDFQTQLKLIEFHYVLNAHLQIFHTMYTLLEKVTVNFRLKFKKT